MLSAAPCRVNRFRCRFSGARCSRSGQRL